MESNSGPNIKRTRNANGVGILDWTLASTEVAQVHDARVGFSELGNNLGLHRKKCQDKQNNHKRSKKQAGQRVVTKAFKRNQAPRDLA
jgi:hypothetical protein